MTAQSRAWFIVVAAGAIGAIMAACGAAPASRSYGGPIPNSDAFVGIVRAGTQTLAYVCDGAMDGVSVSEWFSGPVVSDAADITNAGGAHLQAHFSGTTATGSIALANGQSRNFRATELSGNHGLYRAEGTVATTSANTSYIAGWIVLADGQQRGAIAGGGVLASAPSLNTRTNSVQVSGAGTLAAAKATPPRQALTSSGGSQAQFGQIGQQSQLGQSGQIGQIGQQGQAGQIGGQLGQIGQFGQVSGQLGQLGQIGKPCHTAGFGTC